MAEDAVSSERDSLQAVAAYVASFGVGGRALRVLIRLLTEASWELDSLIRESALSRRTVEGLLDVAAADLDRVAGEVKIRASRRSAYRERFHCDRLAKSALQDGVQIRLRDFLPLVREMERLISEAPAPLPALDHVPATPETVVRRALWLDSTYELAGARLLFVGDHDLSSLAVCSVSHGVSAMVIDLDERTLEFIDELARRRGLDVRCSYFDARLGIPTHAEKWADLVLTDPPFTPEGIQLFIGHGLSGLRDRENGRVVVAYGFGERQLALGLKVQRAIQELNVVFEAILPDFNRYVGAQATGSASDLYVCRPTSRTWHRLDRYVRNAAANIYSQGPQALERAQPSVNRDIARAVESIAGGPDGLAVSALVADAWPSSGISGPHRVSLVRLMSGGLPSAVRSHGTVVVVVDLSADPGAWLLRVLLATNADRIAILVSNNHPDLANEEAQRHIVDSVQPKYRLRLRRSMPTSAHAVVEAERVDASRLADGSRLLRWLFDRAHGKVGNTWREGLIDICGGSLTKKKAQDKLMQFASARYMLDSRLIDLPRHQLRNLAHDVIESVAVSPDV